MRFAEEYAGYVCLHRDCLPPDLRLIRWHLQSLLTRFPPLALAQIVNRATLLCVEECRRHAKFVVYSVETVGEGESARTEPCAKVPTEIHISWMAFMKPSLSS